MFKEVNVYPNPTSDILHIDSSQPLHNITLRNGEGKIVKEELMQSNVANINLSGFSSGVYYLNYVVNGKSETKKVAKVSR
ncbi:MAG: T9SS type A sorting domain-containing protein [Sphingobacteriaceae bacterium]|nr:T9SS type A sorting domain-containing protein [Sphingobacteriaceae bacterium]